MKYALACTLAVWGLWASSADQGTGREVFERRCTGCHAVDRDKSGPRLGGVYGRRAGTVAGFAYSDALRKSGVVWERSTLERWLSDPDSVVPENDMAFRVKDAQERAAILAYLEEISGR
jgi:cytochrome c